MVFLVSLPLYTIGQNWSPTGATWYYGFSVWMTEGYYKIEYIGDTTINAIQCKKLLKTIYWHDLAFMTSDTIVVGEEYTYADSDKVYIYKHNQFYTLYDFSAQVGNTWTVPETKHYNGCDTVGTVKVDSIGTMIIVGQTLRYICVSLADTAQKWGWSAKIVERVGPIKHYNSYDYLFPMKFDFCGMLLDELIEGGNFRCYSDSTPFSYTSNIVPTCDFLTSVTSFEKKIDFVNLFPNPASDYIQYTISDPYKDCMVSILNPEGSIIYNCKNTFPENKISLTGIAAGIYFVMFQYNDKNVVRKLVVIK